MRVLFLTQYYPPEMGAAPARISEFARGLAALGWEVSVLTALPNYPAGRVYPEYRGRWFWKEQAHGVTIRRTWIRPDGSGRVAARLAAAVSFAVSATLSCLHAQRREDVVVAESPPLTLGPAGALIARRLRSAYVMNVSDLWPASLVEMGVLRRPWLIRAAERVEALSYRASSLITAQSPEIVRNIKERFPERAVRLLSNGVDTRFFHPGLRSQELRRSLGLENALLVTYAGLHGLAQGLDGVLEAADRLKGDTGICFLFVGDGPMKPGLMERAWELGLKNVRFLAPAPRDQIATLLASSDIALVTLSRPILGAIPSKVYEAMAVGVPVVAATGGGAAEIVQQAGSGLVAAPGDAEEIAAAVRTLASNAPLRARCGAAGRQLVCEQFDRRLWTCRLAEYLEAAIAARRTGAFAG